jgi:ribosomal protein L9
LSAPAVSVGQVMWYIQGRYNSNAVTVDGVAAGKTAWTGPVAASIFQDIRSDNWNGSNPPTYGTPASYGTTGYYIQQSTGDVFFNNGIFRGNLIGASNIEITGIAKFNGAVTTIAGTAAVMANGTFAQKYGIIAFADNAPYAPVIEAAAVYGYGDNNAFGVRGVSFGTGGTGVFGSGVFAGIEGNASGTSGVGVKGYGNGSAGVGVFGLSNGSGAGVYGISDTGPAVWCNGPFKWSTYTFAVPTGVATDVLRGNGTWGAVTAAYVNNLGDATNNYETVLVGTIVGLQSSATTAALVNSSNNGVFFNGASSPPTLSPTTDNAYSCGFSSFRWTVIYATTGTINTSDRNQKQDEEALSASELAVAKRIKSLIKKYKYKDAVQVKGNDARIHVGVIAQDVRDAFTTEGLDANKYGIFCSDTDEDGVTTLGVRYEELLCFVIAAT